MMNTVRQTFHSIGDRGGDLAKTIGSGTADLARRVSDETAHLAKRVGPRRALIGLAVAAVAIGGSVLVVRFLRARRARGGIGRAEEVTTESTSRSSDRSRTAGAEARATY